MKLLLFHLCLLAIVAVSAFPGPRIRKRSTTNDLDGASSNADFIEQKLDHFNDTRKVKWLQRYMVNDTWYKNASNSPIFLMISGETSMDSKWMTEGSWLNYAQRFGALCFLLEHRFYGQSRPTGDLSLENLKYLTSEQALGDVAEFIRKINANYKLTMNNLWIVFGGSYAGSLAAWSRLKYPDLVYAAVASSAPLLAKADFREYNEIIRQALANSSLECAENVHQAALKVEELLMTAEGVSSLSEKFNACIAIDHTNDLDKANFILQLSYSIQDVVQNNGISMSVDASICEVMTNSSYGDLVDRFAIVASDESGNEEAVCEEMSYKETVNSMKNISYDSGNDERQWMYQLCNEFGYFTSSDSNETLFGSLITLQHQISQCKDIFGDEFDEKRLNDGVAATNAKYGGLNIPVTRVAFLQGSLDPWHAVGIWHSSNPLLPAIFINGTSHCADIEVNLLEEPQQLIAARNETQDQIGRWLSIL
ncbi:unnamed protein product [Nesidiocoris tenuis]|uniref:Serine protease K12H4.7 n=1 Tax=Nesidiocoris tenuis TaxID=355587 RepID=A0A6H5G3L6_9HEMI|nr:unnamed protein product [Nesidiocoris tenuis]